MSFEAIHIHLEIIFCLQLKILRTFMPVVYKYGLCPTNQNYQTGSYSSDDLLVLIYLLTRMDLEIFKVGYAV